MEIKLHGGDIQARFLLLLLGDIQARFLLLLLVFFEDYSFNPRSYSDPCSIRDPWSLFSLNRDQSLIIVQFNPCSVESFINPWSLFSWILDPCSVQSLISRILDQPSISLLACSVFRSSSFAFPKLCWNIKCSILRYFRKVFFKFWPLKLEEYPRFMLINFAYSFWNINISIILRNKKDFLLLGLKLKSEITNSSSKFSKSSAVSGFRFYHIFLLTSLEHGVYYFYTIRP